MVDVDYGVDIDSRLELDPLTGDFMIVEGLDNAKQVVKNRLETRYNELIELGHTNYGNQSYEELGNTDIPIAKGHVEIYTKNCLLEEPLVQDLIDIDITYYNNGFHVELIIKLINGEKIQLSFEITDDLED